MTQEGPKRAPRGPRESLKKAIGGPKVSPREPQESPKTANAFQESPKGPQDSPGARRRPKSAPQEALETQQTPMFFWFALMLEN